MDPRLMSARGRCTSAWEVNPNSTPRQHDRATISQAGREFNSNLPVNALRLAAYQDTLGGRSAGLLADQAVRARTTLWQFQCGGLTSLAYNLSA